ncbi:MAG: peptidylprolyl isomerase [Verrucomicrobiota bacterium]
MTFSSLNRLRLSVMLLTSVATLALGEPPQNAVLAKLGDKSIHESDFNFFLQGMFPPEERAALRTNATARAEALDAYLDLMVLSTKARRDKIDQSTNFEKAHALMQMKLLAQTLSERERERFTKIATSVTEQEVRDYYDLHTNKFQTQPNFTVHQIVVFVKDNPAFPDKGHADAEAAEIAKKALTRLRAGETWDVVAKECSDDKNTGQRGGLLEDGRFGYFPKEMEAAIRQQELGRPGDVVKTDFGYHVLQVEQRQTEIQRQPFEKVKEVIANDVANEKVAAAHRAYLEPIRAAVKLQETPLAEKDTFVLTPPNIKSNDVIATLEGKPVYQADFEWFARDAFRMEQREQMFSRPGARISMVKTFLNMKAMEAYARQQALDKTPDFLAVTQVEEMKLLGEFLQERDRTTPWLLPGKTPEDKDAALKKYLTGLRAEVGFQVATK